MYIIAYLLIGLAVSFYTCEIDANNQTRFVHIGLWPLMLFSTIRQKFSS